MDSNKRCKSDQEEDVQYMIRVLEGKEKSLRRGGRSGKILVNNGPFDFSNLRLTFPRFNSELFQDPTLHKLALQKLKHSGTWNHIHEEFMTLEDFKMAIEFKNTVAVIVLYDEAADEEYKLLLKKHAKELLDAFFMDKDDIDVDTSNSVQVFFWSQDLWTKSPVEDCSRQEGFLNWGKYQEQFIPDDFIP